MSFPDRHDEARTWLGAYALGTLEPAEEQLVEHHLALCPACLAELDDLTAVVPALASLSSSDLESLAPSPDLFRRVAHAVEQEQPAAGQPARRLRPHRRLLALAASVILIAGAGTAVGVAVTSAPSASPATFSAAAGPVRLQVAVTSAASGTRLALTVHGLPGHERCRLVAVAADGTTHDAGSWDATYEGQARVTESTSVSRAQLRKLILYGSDGHKLVTVQLTSPA